MGGVIKEWKCPVHGYFEATHAICNDPFCANEGIERAFLTAPGIGKNKQRNFDGTLRMLSERQGLANFKTNYEGEGARHVLSEPNTQYQPVWKNEAESVQQVAQAPDGGAFMDVQQSSPQFRSKIPFAGQVIYHPEDKKSGVVKGEIP